MRSRRSDLRLITGYRRMLNKQRRVVPNRIRRVWHRSRIGDPTLSCALTVKFSTAKNNMRYTLARASRRYDQPRLSDRRRLTFSERSAGRLVELAQLSSAKRISEYTAGQLAEYASDDVYMFFTSGRNVPNLTDRDLRSAQIEPNLQRLVLKSKSVTMTAVMRGLGFTSAIAGVIGDRKQRDVYRLKSSLRARALNRIPRLADKVDPRFAANIGPNTDRLNDYPRWSNLLYSVSYSTKLNRFATDSARNRQDLSGRASEILLEAYVGSSVRRKRGSKKKVKRVVVFSDRTRVRGNKRLPRNVLIRSKQNRLLFEPKELNRKIYKNRAFNDLRRLRALLLVQRNASFADKRQPFRLTYALSKTDGFSPGLSFVHSRTLDHYSLTRLAAAYRGWLTFGLRRVELSRNLKLRTVGFEIGYRQRRSASKGKIRYKARTFWGHLWRLLERRARFPVSTNVERRVARRAKRKPRWWRYNRISGQLGWLSRPSPDSNRDGPINVDTVKGSRLRQPLVIRVIARSSRGHNGMRSTKRRRL